MTSTSLPDLRGPWHLTFTAEEGVEAGWKHFSESRTDIERAFDHAGLAGRVRWLAPGVPY